MKHDVDPDPKEFTTVNVAELLNLVKGDAENAPESVINKGQPMYSDRDSESVSNRSLLVKAFEDIAQNDIERKMNSNVKRHIHGLLSGR